jgi:Ala-tRNA(Pro) deacylase
MATATWIKDMLDLRGIPYEERRHRAAFTARGVARREHVGGHGVAKVVVVLADWKPVELILPADRRVALERVRKLLGAAEVRLASEAEMERIFTECETGAIPPLRHWENVMVLVDDSLGDVDDLVFQAGTHEDAIRVKFRDWSRLMRPLVESFSEPDQGCSLPSSSDGDPTGAVRAGAGLNPAAWE